VFKNTGTSRKRKSTKYSKGEGSASRKKIRQEVGSGFSSLQTKPGLQDKALDFLHASIAKRTWQKYNSGWKAFEEFEDHVETTFAWPLTKDTLRGFTAYCLAIRKIQSASVRAYISSLAMLHKLKGFTNVDLQDDIVNMMLRGADNLILAAGIQPHNNRRAMTLPLLRHFGHRLNTSGWHPTTKQCFWTAGLIAFFGTVRMGELLSPTEKHADPTTTLTWEDVHFREEDRSFLIHLKIPKTAPKQGEFVDIFKFKKFGCCPVAALENLRRKQQEMGKGNPQDPVFIFPGGRFMTTSSFNAGLKSLMNDICDFKVKQTIKQLAPFTHNPVHY